MSDPKVVSFPKAKSARGGPKADAELAADLKKAWRKLWRTIHAARSAGLDVSVTFTSYDDPRIIRKL